MTVKAKDTAEIGVLGCSGRVGSLIVREIREQRFGESVALAGGTVRAPAPADFFTTTDADALFSRANVLIDFTTPEATAKHVWLAAKHHKPLVIGTTGLNPQQAQEIRDAANETSIVYAANMSVGVNLLLALVEQAAASLGPEWDIEIAETHHRYKVDAPSGTALALGKAAEKGLKALSPRGEGLGEGDMTQTAGIISPSPQPSPQGERGVVLDRSGKREPGTIGFAVQRGGDVAGEHMVSFFGEGERLELGHKAANRAIFAKGAIRAALWVKDQPRGLYSMRDVLGL